VALEVLLWCAAALLGTGVAAVATARHRIASTLVYGVALGATVIAMLVAAWALLAQHPPALARLPLGLPWLGAHLRLDALAAFSLLVVNLGGAAASLYALGYGRHEDSRAGSCPSTRHSSPG